MKTLLLDFDGVIGTEQKFLSVTGDRALLQVSSRDTAALQSLRDRGVRVVIATASHSQAIRMFAHKYQCECVQNRDKMKGLEMMGLEWDNVVAVGDSLQDIPMMRKAKVAFCPADADYRVKNLFPSLQSSGGNGVIVELQTKIYGINEPVG